MFLAFIYRFTHLHARFLPSRDMYASQHTCSTFTHPFPVLFNGVVPSNTSKHAYTPTLVPVRVYFHPVHTYTQENTLACLSTSLCLLLRHLVSPRQTYTPASTPNWLHMHLWSTKKLSAVFLLLQTRNSSQISPWYLPSTFTHLLHLHTPSTH